MKTKKIVSENQEYEQYVMNFLEVELEDAIPNENKLIKEHDKLKENSDCEKLNVSQKLIEITHDSLVIIRESVKKRSVNESITEVIAFLSTLGGELK